MGGKEASKQAGPAQPLAEKGGPKARMRFLSPLFDRFNGNHAPPPEEKPRQAGLGIARHERKSLSAYLGSVDIALDRYDELFSDFDSSPFERRAFSGDFLRELMRRYSETRHGNIEVVFSLPRAGRNTETERLIKQRIKEHFGWQLEELWDDIKDDRRTGRLYIGFGAAVIALSVLLTTYGQAHVALKILGEILLVPGWVGEFMGLEKILESKPQRKKQREFLEHFRDATYVFVSSEDVLDKMVAAKARPPPAQKDGGSTASAALPSPN